MGEGLKFISVHIPKCGGTAFRRQVIGKMFPNKVAMDYCSQPFNDNFHVRGEECDIIHGHFRATKYNSYDRPIITWIRNPVDRVVSHYWYSKKKLMWTGGGAAVGKSSFLEFVEGNSNLMAKFLNIPLNDFAFIGVLEFFKSSMRRFFNTFGTTGPLYNFLPRRYGLSEELRVFIKKENAEDLAIWKEVVKRHENAGCAAID